MRVRFYSDSGGGGAAGHAENQRLNEVQLSDWGTWVSPTSANGTNWDNPTYAIDDDTVTYAEHLTTAQFWNDFTTLTHPGVYTNQVRFYARFEATYSNEIDIDAYYGDAWHDIYEGIYVNNTWITKDFPGLTPVSVTAIGISSGNMTVTTGIVRR